MSNKFLVLAITTFSMSIIARMDFENLSVLDITLIITMVLMWGVSIAKNE